jgi:hypothetical protein
MWYRQYSAIICFDKSQRPSASRSCGDVVPYDGGPVALPHLVPLIASYPTLFSVVTVGRFRMSPAKVFIRRPGWGQWRTMTNPWVFSRGCLFHGRSDSKQPSPALPLHGQSPAWAGTTTRSALDGKNRLLETVMTIIVCDCEKGRFARSASDCESIQRVS